MKKTIFERKSNIKINESVEAISLEQKLRQVTTTKEPIDATAPIIYTERKDGVIPAYDPRTDRFEIAQEAMDRVTKTITTQRENKPEVETPIENKE